MKPILSCCKLIIQKSPIHGYGVFAGQDINAGQRIEECHALNGRADDKTFEDYYFAAMRNNSEVMILPLGYGCIYNHSAQPNAKYKYDVENSLMLYTAISPIKTGEEITIDYGEEWFSSRKTPIKKPSMLFSLRRRLSHISLFIRFGVVVGVIIGLIKIMPIN